VRNSPHISRGEIIRTNPRRRCISIVTEGTVADLVSEDRKDDSPDQARTAASVVIPVIEEHLAVSKELLTTGLVRVHKSVREQEVSISEPLSVEAVQVERVPMNLMVEAVPAVRTEGDVMVIPVVEEVLVTTKQIRLVEELRITKHRSTHLHQENVVLRSEEVTVDRQSSGSLNEAAEERPD